MVIWTGLTVIPKKGKYVKFTNYERKIKPLFIIYADFESVLVPEDNGKQHPEEPYTNKYQKHIACSYGYKLVCIGDKFSKPFKTYLGEDAVYNFINNMMKESKYYSDVIKKPILLKNLWWLKKAMKILRTLLNVGSVTMIVLIIILKQEIIFRPLYFMKTHLYCLTLFSNFVHSLPFCCLQPHPHSHSVALFIWLNGWLCYIWCAILLNDIMDLHMLSFGTLVPEGCVFYANLLRSGT